MCVCVCISCFHMKQNLSMGEEANFEKPKALSTMDFDLLLPCSPEADEHHISVFCRLNPSTVLGYLFCFPTLTLFFLDPKLFCPIIPVLLSTLLYI